jgi:hypothetical protein
VHTAGCGEGLPLLRSEGEVLPERRREARPLLLFFAQPRQLVRHATVARGGPVHHLEVLVRVAQEVEVLNGRGRGRGVSGSFRTSV